jgi:predicted small lipoprotein YifL
MSRPTIRALLAATTLSTLLAACGGGGPDVPPSGPAPAPAPPPVTITAAPADVTVDDGQPATFSFGVSTQLPYSVEWRRDGSLVASVRQATTFTLPTTSLADDGATFSARVLAGTNSANGSSSVTTVEAGSARLNVNLATPAAPSSLSVDAGAAGTAFMTWTDASNNESGFDVIRVVNGQDVTVTTVPANQTSFTMTGLVPGAAETLRVRAMRAAAGRVARSAATSLTLTMPGGVGATPAAPSNARWTVVPGTTLSAEFAWDDNANDETGFEVYQVLGGSDHLRGFTDVNQTKVLVTGLAAGATLTYRVRAVRRVNGTTTRSATASATITLPSNSQAQVVTLTATQDNVRRYSTIDPAVANQVLRDLPIEVGCTYIVDFGAAGSAATCSQSLVVFDVRPIAGHTIRRAELRLAETGAAVTFTPVRELRIGAVQQAWNPATVNAATTLSLSTTGLVTAPLATVAVDRTFDVTTIVSRWASGAQLNNGFGIMLTDESIPGNVPAGAYAMANFFGSRENTIVANRPQLVVEFE